MRRDLYDILNIVHTCRVYEGGLESLVDVLKRFECGSKTMRDLLGRIGAGG